MHPLSILQLCASCVYVQVLRSAPLGPGGVLGPVIEKKDCAHLPVLIMPPNESSSTKQVAGALILVPPY